MLTAARIILALLAGLSPALDDDPPPPASLVGITDGYVLDGVVLDAHSRRPVPLADVEVAGVGTVTTNPDGRFRIATGPAAFAVRATRVGYRPRTWDRLRPASGVELVLVPEPFTLEGITVTAGRTPLPEAASGPVTVIALDDPPPAVVDPAQLVRATPGVFGRDYVNYTSLALRGTEVEHTMLALDGIPLNSAQNGTFDLSTLPAAFFNRVEVVRGGASALYGSSPVGGLVDFQTAEPERLAARARTGLAAFGARRVSAVVENRRAPLGFLLGVSADATANDFTWLDDSGASRTMTNADRSSLAAFAKGSWRAGAHRFSLFGLAGSTERGVPGPRNWPSDSARRDEVQGFTYLRHVYEPDEQLRTDTRVRVGRWWQNYRDPAAFVPASDTHDLADIGLQADAAWSPLRWLSVLGAVEASNAELASTAVGRPSRLDLAAVGQLRLTWLGFALQPALRVERLRQDISTDSAGTRSTTDVASPRVTLAWTGWPYAAPFAAFGRSFRAPTFNDLYWPEDQWTYGNPQLRPEWATNIELGVRGRGRDFTNWWLGWYRNALTDLIQWQADSLYRFRPVNVASATTSGLEAELSLDLGAVGLTGNVNWCRAESEGKRLLNRPELTARATAWADASWRAFDAKLTVSADASGDRLTDPVFPDTVPVVMPAYGVYDAGLALGWSTGKARLGLSAGVRNLTNARYETARFYPVPGRSWYAELGFDFR